jgi:hypothetical protein
VLFLFSDVGPDDAPTRLMCGSHLAVPEFLARTVGALNGHGLIDNWS